MASTSESRSGASRILTDNAIECILDDSSESDSCISTCSEREEEVIPVAHTHNRKVISSGTRILNLKT
jgi:hypothetical protein